MARRNEVDATQLFRLRYPRSLWAWTQELDWRITGRWMFYAVLIGVLVAFWALLFSHLVSLLTKQILVDGAGYALPLPRGEGGSELFDLKRAMHPTRRWLLLLAPTLGGLLVGWIIHMFASEAETRGTDSVIRAFHHEHGVVRPRLALVQTIGSALTIGTGGSSGREGPIAQIGAALSTWLAQRFQAVMGSSYGWLQQAILGNLPLSLMALLALLKMLATAFTVGSGQLGGTFAPSLVIGGMLAFKTRYPALPALDAQGAIVGFLRPHQLISEYHRALLRSSTASSSHDVS